MPLSTVEKLGGDTQYKTAADDGLADAFPMLLGLLLILDLAFTTSMLGLGIGMLLDCETAGSCGGAVEACEEPSNLAKRFLRT